MASTINQTNKLKGYKFKSSPSGSFLKILQVALASGWFLSLSQSLQFWMALAFISKFSILNGLRPSSSVQVQFQEGYVLKFYVLPF